jgi:chromate transporter
LKIYKQLFFTFFKIGLFTFGGGLAMIPFIKNEVVDKKKWITSSEMIDVIAIAESTPGVLAVNTASYVGYKIGKFWGSFFSTIAVILPSLIVIIIISLFIQDFLEIQLVKYAFYGIKAGVTILIFRAALIIFKNAPKSTFGYTLMIFAFLLTLFNIYQSIILIISGAIIGLGSYIISLIEFNLLTKKMNECDFLPCEFEGGKK